MDILDAQFRDILLDQAEDELKNIAVEQEIIDSGNRDRDRRLSYDRNGILDTGDGSWLGLDNKPFNLLSPNDFNGSAFTAQEESASKEAEVRIAALQRIHKRVEERRTHFLQWTKQLVPEERVTLEALSLFSQICVEGRDLREGCTWLFPSIKCTRENHQSTARLVHCLPSRMCVDTSLLEIIIPGSVRFHMRAPASVSGEENNLNPMGNGKASLIVEEKFETTTGKHLYDGGDVANMTRDLRGVASDGLATIVTQIAESSPSALNVTNGVSMSRDGTLEDGSISCLSKGLGKISVNDVMLTLSTGNAGAASLANMENASVIRVPEYSETDLSPCTPT